MSVITDNTSVSSIIQPSLVYPSLPRRKHNSYQPAPLFHRYRSIDAEDEVSSQDESVVNSNTKELQTCIHFASRLIKLRSELRSPSYMKTRTTSMQMQYNDYFQQQHQHYNEENRSTTSRSQTLSEVGRVQSLPNVSQLSGSDNEHPYSKKKFLHFCEDESEIISLNSNSTDEASQLTYLTELIRRGNSKKDTVTSGNLSLPPKHLSSDYERKNLSLTPSNTFKKNHRSLSLRDMIHEVIDEGMNSKGDDKKIVQPIKRERFSSLALASQLLYASQSTEEKETKEVDFYKEKTEINEGELLHLQREQEQKDVKREEEEEEKEEENALSEKVEIKDEIHSKFLNSFNKQQDRLSVTLSTDEKKISTKTITPAAVIRPPPVPKGSLSSNTNKSLFSTLSSDSESEEESSSHHSGSMLFSKRKVNYNKRRPTAFLVSISPSSAAAATVAKSRRSQKRQQAVVMRTKLAEVYADKEKPI